MKKLLLLMLLVKSITTFSQEILWLGISGGDFGLEFPSDTQFVKIDTNHVWFITKAGKSILFPSNPFNNHQLVTDTADYYNSNVVSSFNFKLLMEENDYYFINFYHKYDFEENKDGGIVETSYDNGETWQNFLYDTIIQNNVLEIVNFYDVSDTISSYGNQPGFTGLQSGYSSSNITFFANPEIYLDTMLLRFTISTDAVDAQNEGWMLDDFYFEGGDYWSIKDNNSNSGPKLYPNPAQTMLIIESEKHNISQVSVLSLIGETVIEKKGDNITSVNIDSLDKGFYLVICRNNGNNYWIFKIVKG